MARAKPKPTAANSVLISAQKGLAEQRRAFEQDDEARSRSNTLLRPDDILSGEVDAGKLWKYMTSRHGELRPLTMDDLLEFKRRTDALKARYKKGIKAKDVIDLSLPDDRERAKKQIRTAVPHTVAGGQMRFMTNAGPNSDRQRHYVTVRLLNFEAAVVSAKKSNEIVKEVINGPLAISCDCGRWRYWHAFQATAGGYNANPKHRESAFPKIRNPQLHGLACKHLIRVCVSLAQSASVRNYVMRLIDDERNRVSTRMQRQSMKQMRELEESMRKEGSRTRQIKTSEEKRQQRQAQPSYQRQLEQQRAMRASAAKKPAAQARVSDTKFIQMLMQAGFSQAAAQAALTAAKAAQ